MKNINTIKLSLIITVIFGFSLLKGQDSITMGPSYANDVYYSLKDGEVSKVDRKNWDIAFHTSVLSAGIITNGSNGVELYTYPNSDTSGWDNIDTTGLSKWIPLFNSPDEWEDGAFNRNSMGLFDYGWGVYNMVSHNVLGDSLYIIKLADGSFRKLWIQIKRSSQNIYEFKYANLDGSDEVFIPLDCSQYTSKRFVYFSLPEQNIVDREPEFDTWDIVFTRYMGDISGTPYPVAGVLNNIDVAANKFTEVGPDFDDWTDMPVDTAKSPVGYDWKSFSMGPPPGYEVDDSTAFFVQSLEGNVYKLVFTAFDYLDATFKFNIQLVSSLGIPDAPAGESAIRVYPNPAKDYVNISLAEMGVEQILVRISDLSGKLIVNIPLKLSGMYERIDLPVMNPGLYILSVETDRGTSTSKLMISFSNT